MSVKRLFKRVLVIFCASAFGLIVATMVAKASTSMAVTDPKCPPSTPYPLVFKTANGLGFCWEAGGNVMTHRIGVDTASGPEVFYTPTNSLQGFEAEITGSNVVSGSNVWIYECSNSTESCLVYVGGLYHANLVQNILPIYSDGELWIFDYYGYYSGTQFIIVPNLYAVTGLFKYDTVFGPAFDWISRVNEYKAFFVRTLYWQRLPIVFK